MSRVQPDCVSPDRSPDELVALRRSLATRAKPLATFEPPAFRPPCAVAPRWDDDLLSNDQRCRRAADGSFARVRTGGEGVTDAKVHHWRRDSVAIECPCWAGGRWRTERSGTNRFHRRRHALRRVLLHHYRHPGEGDHEKGTAEATYRPRKVEADKLKAEIEKLGYTVTGMETESVES